MKQVEDFYKRYSQKQVDAIFHFYSIKNRKELSEKIKELSKKMSMIDIASLARIYISLSAFELDEIYFSIINDEFFEAKEEKNAINSQAILYRILKKI